MWHLLWAAAWVVVIFLAGAFLAWIAIVEYMNDAGLTEEDWQGLWIEAKRREEL